MVRGSQARHKALGISSLVQCQLGDVGISLALQTHLPHRATSPQHLMAAVDQAWTN